MEKFCVFCGQKPDSKNNEHILPRWLLELTGDPRREVELGSIWGEKLGRKRKFSFQSFKFPACESCNDEFSKLEGESKCIFQQIFSLGKLRDYQFNTLFNWFDKVRIGLWLAYHYLDQNFFGISPKYHIKDRIGVNDRMLKIYRRDTDWVGLSFSGATTPSFYHTPNCIMLFINNYAFLSASGLGLFSRRIGFPYFTEQFALSLDLDLKCKIAPGLQRIMFPLIKKQFALRGTELYQPIYKKYVYGEASELFQSNYVVERSMDKVNGIGKIFALEKNSYSTYPSTPTEVWIPAHSYTDDQFVKAAAIETLEFQILINNILRPSYELLGKTEQKHMELQHRHLDMLNRIIIERIKKEGSY